MGVELLEIGVKVRKCVVFTIRGCYRSVCSHPFLVGILCFLIFLYRLSPFFFHLLVSASPILVCTAVLLGTLLSFGQPNIPEIEVEEITTLEAASIKTGFSGEAAVVEGNESYYVERFSEKGWDERENSTDLSVGQLGEVRREDSDDTAPLIEERSTGIDGEIWEGKREVGDLGYERKSDWIEERLGNGEVMENHYALAGTVNDEVVESDDEKSQADSFDSEKVNVDSLDSPPRSPWARVEDREDQEEEDEEEDGSDSESSRAESSSPDASMADIMPMLDELHPLLDEEAARTDHIALDGSDAASEKSRKSSRSGHESDDDESENHDHLEVADDDNEDEEGEKEEQTKSAITWTEEDQKNLMDLGSSEIERNQRLENLILRRRSRKMLAERNLIDLEGSDLPFNIAPISTRRQNPFDLPNDDYDNSGLPPIPGSAPSVLLQRRNPFDIPYDSSEEKPDLMGDGFQEEFRTSQSREPVFRRHESFNVGPSNFAPRRKDIKMRPYFIPEGSISEGSSSSLFQRQSSELSESKLSSVPDTESISSVTSVEDQEERKFPEEDILPEVEVIAHMREVTEEGPSGDPELISQQEVTSEEDVHRELETISKMETVAEHVGHGSQSSEEEEKEDPFGVDELEPQMEGIADHYEERYTRDSSSSSLSEESERVFTVIEGEGLSMLEERRDDVALEPRISTRTSVESTDLNINVTPQREPVYDTSPRALSKNVSSSSISSDMHPESDLGSLPVIDKSTVSSNERESDSSVFAHRVDVVDIREDDYVNTELYGVGQRSIGESSSVDTVIAPHMSVPLKSSDEASESSEDRNMEEAQEYSVPSGRDDVIEVNEPPFEGHLSQEHSFGMDEIVHSPDSDADEKLISTTSSGENTTIFHDKAINEPNLIHLNEVQASSIPLESFVDGQITQESNTPEFREFDDFISSNINSPSSPQCISQPSAIETTTSLVDVQTVVEEVDEIKEIDEGLLSELDNVGDFSVNQLGSDSAEFEKHMDFFGLESLPSQHHAETSTMTDVEFHPVEVNKVEDAFHSEILRGCVDIHEEDFEHISELHTSETSIVENIEVSRMEFNENGGQDSNYRETSGEDTLSRENEVQPGHSLVDHSYEDTFSTVPEQESQPLEDINAIPLEKAQSTSPETEIIGEGAELPDQGQFDTDTPSGMAILEASTIEDIDLAFKQISSEEIEKSVALEPNRVEETVSAMPESETQCVKDVDAVPLEESKSTSVETEAMVGVGEVTAQGQVDADIPSEMFELEASKIEDIDLAFTKISSSEIENAVTLEKPQAELHIIEYTTSMIPESDEDVDAVPQKAGSASSETEIMVGDREISTPAQVDTDTDSGMAEVEAGKIEDIDLAFKQISSQETEKPVYLEPPQAEVAVRGAIAENSEDGVPNIVSTFQTSVVEVEPIKDATVDQDSVEHTLNVVTSEETPIAAEDHIMPADQALDGESLEQPKLNSDDRSAEVKADNVGPSEDSSSVTQTIVFATEKTDSPSSDKGKGKISRSLSSSSSSSSESSSSDSDKE